MKRRKFLLGAMGASAATAVGAIGAPVVHAQKEKVFNWKLVTSWPPNFPIFQTGLEEMVKNIETMSDGRLKIKVFAANELAPPFGVFDAVSQGTVEMGHSAAYYWSGKVPAVQFFTSVPYGFNAQQMNAWFYDGGGIELLNEIYAKYNIFALPSTNTGVQMGGWFRKEIKTINDLKGLKMRIPGLGGKVMSRAGVNVTLLPPAELYTALERGVIDALEWVGPYHDLKLGFYKAASYYYYPGWHEPGTVLELEINRAKWDSLPNDLKEIVKAAAAYSNVKSLAQFDARNGAALNELITKYKVKVLEYPEPVLKQLRVYADETLKELAASDKDVARVYKSFKDFAAIIEPWAARGEAPFHRLKG